MIPEKASDTLLSAKTFAMNYTILASGAKLNETLMRTIELK